MKCPLCIQRKAKRHCPAKQVSICPQCCGEKRVVEISCPVDCQYLAAGQGFQASKELVHQLSQLEDPVLGKKILDIRIRFPAVFHLLERIIVEYAESLSSLTDQDVVEATAIVLERYRLEQKGLIYQDRSPKPFVESLSLELARGIEEARNSEDQNVEEGTRLPLELFVTALEVAVADIEYHSKKGDDPRIYLEHIRKNHPEVEARGRESGLIIPP